MPTYKLTYFDSRGRAEVARIIMAYGGIEYEDIRFEKAQWPAMKARLNLIQSHPDLPVGQLPMLEVDGEILVQSHAINRFLANKAGLMGTTDMEAGRIDMTIECLADYTRGLLAIYAEKDEDKKKALRQKYQDELPAETAKLEKFIKDGHFVGNKMTLADINAAHIITSMPILGVTLNLDDFPKLKAVHDKVFSEPKIAAWVKERPETTM